MPFPGEVILEEDAIQQTIESLFQIDLLIKMFKVTEVQKIILANLNSYKTQRTTVGNISKIFRYF